jgi:hypothetical protein
MYSDLGGGRERLVVFSRTNAELPADLRLHLAAILGQDSPAGGPSLALENILFTDAFGNTFPAGVSYSFLEQWRRDHFSQVERDDPALIADDADPDGDGIVNLAEAAAARDPHTPESLQTGLDAVPVNSNGLVRLALRFLAARELRAREAAGFTAVTGTDLATWTNAGVAIAPTGGGDLTAAEMEASVVSTNRVRFLLLNVERLPAP